MNAAPHSEPVDTKNYIEVDNGLTTNEGAERNDALFILKLHAYHNLPEHGVVNIFSHTKELVEEKVENLKLSLRTLPLKFSKMKLF